MSRSAGLLLSMGVVLTSPQMPLSGPEGDETGHSGVGGAVNPKPAPESVQCRRCGHSKDEHWYSGFVCVSCACSLFKPAAVVSPTPTPTGEPAPSSTGE